MKPDVQHSSATFETTVTSEMTAVLDGNPIHPVYSTFWLSHHAEVAARRAIEPYFENDENAVGGELFIHHEAMCAVGDSVRIVATVTKVHGRKIVCSIEAFSSSRRIATGHQTQIVLSNNTIASLVDEAYSLLPK